MSAIRQVGQVLPGEPARRGQLSELVRDGTFGVMVVRVADPDDPGFESRLAEQVSQHPGFSANAAVVLDIAGCPGLATVDAFEKLRLLFKRQYLVPIGIQHGNATQIRAAANAGLAAFPESGAPIAPPQRAGSESSPVNAVSGPGRTRVVTQPVRSGTQVYAKGGDLIVLAAVSAGAEVLADGNVHIYGPLRGRAIAGAAGDVEARIFVRQLEAELLCVAGHYLVSEAIEPEFRGQSVQVSLAEDKLLMTRT